MRSSDLDSAEAQHSKLAATGDDPRDESRRARYRLDLEARLRHPGYTSSPGFPEGSIDDILALSDPPFFTACPNPYLRELISRHGTPYDELTDTYARAPFSADVTEGKHHAVYKSYSYHTKVPHQAIMRYILHYTDPGDIVLDGFCGTGMTGVAAQMCAFPDASCGGEAVRWGARRAVLCDLSPLATFVSYAYNAPLPVARYEAAVAHLLSAADQKVGWMYHTQPPKLGGHVVSASYFVWSQVFLCPACGCELAFWDVAVSAESGEVSSAFTCSGCGAQLTKARCPEAFSTSYDHAVGGPVAMVKSVPVWVHQGRKPNNFHYAPTAYDLNVLRRVEQADAPWWYPKDRVPPGDESNRNERIGLTHAHHFFTRRNLLAFSCCWELAAELPYDDRRFLLFTLLSTNRRVSVRTAWHPLRFGQASMSGTLYVPSVSVENNLLDLLRTKARQVKGALRASPFSAGDVVVSTGSCAQLDLPDNCIDYIFIDPPFGQNLQYSELNFLLESWLRVRTSDREEAVINKTQGKSLGDYRNLMERCLSEMYRVLKPGRWITVEFHNSHNAVWHALQEAIARAGFIVADVRVLDKKQMSFKQITASGAVKRDLVISAYKPRPGLERRIRAAAGSELGVWELVESHLSALPVGALDSTSSGKVEVTAERQDCLLYDRMVAFYVQRGLAVPLSAATFYDGLRARFPMRDGMCFLPEQAVRYDALRLTCDAARDDLLPVVDEQSALRWLRLRLTAAPSTYRDLHAPFLRACSGWRHDEGKRELRELLEENFVCRGEEWTIPDPGQARDVAAMRERRLLREFREVTAKRGPIRGPLRREAIRAGFRKAWADADYETIIAVADRLPAELLMDDESLMLYYDQAQSRTGRL
ncbi:MAG: DNA methylase [Candidatus Schekmanbacteria bacterium]|nr:DNA methylase [Candidatus Schekmanbacteria bacterium]